MHSADILSQLRTLDWLAQEAQRLPVGSSQRLMLAVQMEAIRARLPIAMLRYYDERAKHHEPCVAELRGSTCGHCQVALAEEFVLSLRGRDPFSLCPHCGILLWSGEGKGDGNSDAARSRPVRSKDGEGAS